MNPGQETSDPSGALSSAEVESLLATVANAEQQDNPVKAVDLAEVPSKEGVQPHDFRNPMLLSPRELRKLRLHQEEFVNALAARLSLYLRLEFSLKLTGLQTIAFQKFAQSWANPSHLTLFKIEPLRGVSILEIPPRLGSAMVDRLMGGSGQAAESAREMSEIEKALLEQAVRLMLGEWCGHWSKWDELKPVLLGYESNGRFIQTAPPETVMLVLSLEARFGDCTERMQIGFPHAALEPMISKLSRGAETMVDAGARPATPAACKWNPSFDDVRIPVTAEWQGLELAAREVLALKVGDVLQFDRQSAQQVKVRLGEIPRFEGRPGAVAGKWAVELTQAIDR